MKQLYTSSLFVLLLVAHVLAVPYASTLELLVAPTAQSLRGESIDTGDAYSRARLLAHFGEYKLAYDLMRRRGATSVDPEANRFEARLLTEIGLPARADSLLSNQPSPVADRDYYLLNLQRARLNQLAERPARSLHFLETIAAADLPLFDPYRDMLMVEMLAAMERFDDAYEVGERRMQSGVPSSLSPEFEEALFTAYVEGGNYTAAANLVETLRSRGAKHSIYASLYAQEVGLLLAAGDTTGAVTAAMDAVENAKSREIRSEAARAIVEAVTLSTLPDDALVVFGEVLLGDRRMKDVARVIDELDERELAGETAELSRMLEAQYFYREKRYSKSYALLEREFERDSLERNAMLYRARIFRKTGQAIRSADAYRSFAIKFPYDAKAAEALFVAADLYERSGRHEDAVATLAKVSQTYPSHRYGRLSALKRAFDYMERGQTERAIALLDETLQGTHRRSEDLLYYLSVAYEAAGNEDMANEIYDELREVDPSSFYLAPEIQAGSTQPVMGSDGRVRLDGDEGLIEFLSAVFRGRELSFETVREQIDPIEDPTALDRHEANLLRGRLFLEVGFRDWAERELRVLEKQGRLPPRVDLELGGLYDDYAMHWRSTRAFQRVYYSFSREKRRELDAELKILTHPIPFPALVFENCSRYGISPHIVYAMMRQESRFQVDAVSSAGARGLMQLMPRTSAQVASELGFDDDVQENILVPEINLTLGIWYASHLLGRTGRDPVMMLCAYNAGMGNARRWFKGEESSRVEAVDGIDYRETRDYVKRIVENAHVYRNFYFSTAEPGDADAIQ